MSDWENRKSLLKIMLAEIEADELAKKPKRGRPPLYTKDEIKERVRQQRKKCWDKHAKQYYENRRKKLKEV
jgi:hypothetical protein